jgi:hypothetical protein
VIVANVTNMNQYEFYHKYLFDRDHMKNDTHNLWTERKVHIDSKFNLILSFRRQNCLCEKT